MQTGNFSTAGSHPDAIAICRGVPGWFKGARYEALAPTRAMLDRAKAGGTTEEFDKQYDAILAKLDPKKVAKELRAMVNGEPILLCWEGFNVRCHRRRVAEWFEKALRIKVAELNYERTDSTPYKEQPRKAAKPAKAKAKQRGPSLFEQSK
jgi:hypothetical protein